MPRSYNDPFKVAVDRLGPPAPEAPSALLALAPLTALTSFSCNADGCRAGEAVLADQVALVGTGAGAGSLGAGRACPAALACARSSSSSRRPCRRGPAQPRAASPDALSLPMPILPPSARHPRLSSCRRRLALLTSGR
jgi:hypothetical protein